MQTFLWLTFGLDADNQLVAIADAPRGKTDLICPYCGDRLIAKKGKVKAHHFAHQTESCRLIERPEIELPRLPCYDRFNLYLSPKELEQLTRLWNWGRIGERVPREKGAMKLALKGFLRRLPSEPPYEFADIGKIPFGALPLKQFCQVQEPLMEEKLAQLQRKAEREPNDLNTTDLRIYRAQYDRVKAQTIYFLRIQADGKTLHKIGVTTRSLSQRLAEIRRDLQEHFEKIAIAPLGTWEGRGNVELYFKHRYREWNYAIGSLTEYFLFPDALAVLADLQAIASREE